MSLGLPNEDMEMLNAAQEIIEKVLASSSPEDLCEPVVFCNGCAGDCAADCTACAEAWRPSECR